MADYVARLLGAEYAAVGLFQADGTLRAFHTAGMAADTEAAIGQPPRGTGLLGELFRNPAPERIHDLRGDPRFRGFPEGHPDMRTLVAHPLQRGGRTFGVLYAAERTDGLPFSPEDSAYLSMFAAQMADVLERLELTASLEERAEDLHRQLLTAVKVFTNLLELRSPDLARHARRVAEVAVAVGRRLGLDEAALETLHIAGLLHDVGMLALPDTMLRKPYSLLHSGDRKRMREHPLLGEANLMALEALDPAARLIRHHHEYLDGSGYPDGLQGEAIPLQARVLTVANEFDDLVEGTLFVRRLSPDKALAYLVERVDRHYDGRVVAALAAHLGMPEAVAATEGEGGEALAGPNGGPEPSAAGHPSGDAAGGSAEAAAGPVRTLESARLQEGMTLARDLVTEEGMLLLSQGYVLDEALIRKIRYFERRLGRRFRVAVVDQRPRPASEG
jgi:HD-GYP domain-containing protein (c-di-GMP phosphodiesterase class II)